MPNDIEFKVSAAVNYGLAPLPFIAQFAAPAAPVPGIVNLPDPGQVAGVAALIAAALDGGYGSNLIPPMPILGLADQLALQQFLQRRLDLTLSLLHQDANGDWVAQPFASILDATALSDESYALGMLYARVATEEWATASGWGALQHFWHFNVLKHSAMNFNALGLLQVMNPDFLVRHGNGNWACVEAKGTWGGLKHAELKGGMLQAEKLQQISWVNPVNGALVQAIPVDAVCTMAYFTPTLEVLHLDPPGNAKALAASDGAAPIFLLEAGQFLGWIEAGHQLRALLGGDADASWDEELVWASWPDHPEIQIGGPQALLSASHALAVGVEVLSWLVPRLGRWRRSALRQPEREAQRVIPRLRRLATEARRLASSEKRAQGAWLRLSRLLQKLGQDGHADLKWTDVLVEVWAADLLIELAAPPNRPFSSLRRLHDWLNGTVSASRERWQLDANLPASGMPPTPRSIHSTSHGLLVVAPGDNAAPRGPAIP